MSTYIPRVRAANRRQSLSIELLDTILAPLTIWEMPLEWEEQDRKAEAEAKKEADEAGEEYVPPTPLPQQRIPRRMS